MHPKLTDQAVGDLPLSHGRADLLEEIMRTPVLDDTTTPATGRAPRRTARWIAPLAAAATVAGLATAPVWWPDGDVTPVTLEERPDLGAADRPSGRASAPPSSQPSGPETGHLAVLDASGWTVTHVEKSSGYGSISYARRSMRLEVSWYPAPSYAGYVEDREHLVDPPAPGEPVEVLGAAGQLWPYSATDHTVIRGVQDGHWMEIRGSGMDEDAYRDLLAALRLVDEAGFEAALPSEFVTAGEREDGIRRMLAEIEAVSGVGPYDGADPIRSGQSDPYQLGVDVAGGYACGWITAYVDAVASGDRELEQQAAGVLGTARKWPVLLRMDERGDYPEVLWDYADQVGSGRVPEGYEGGLGCG